MLRHGQLCRQNRNIRAFRQVVAALQNATLRYRNLDKRYRAFKTPAGKECLYRQNEKLRPEPKEKKSGLAKIGGDTMNRLRMMLVGAALVTGGSALASAQMVQQDVAFRDHR